MLTVTFEDFSTITAHDEDHAAISILHAHADGVGVLEITDDDGNKYGCDWDVKVSKII